MNANINLLDINSIAFYNMGGFNPDYRKHCENAVKIRNKVDTVYNIPLFPTVSIGWDDTPRFPAKGREHATCMNQSPEVFAEYLAIAKEYADQHAQQQPKFIMINAWNEWTEGMALIPDETYGTGYLDTIKKITDDMKGH